jgi:hypothetical protein
VRWVLEPRGVHQQHLLSLQIESTNRAEVAVASLLESLPAYVDDLKEAFDPRGGVNCGLKQVEVHLVNEQCTRIMMQTLWFTFMTTVF